MPARNGGSLRPRCPKPTQELGAAGPSIATAPSLWTQAACQPRGLDTAGKKGHEASSSARAAVSFHALSGGSALPIQFDREGDQSRRCSTPAKGLDLSMFGGAISGFFKVHRSDPAIGAAEARR